MVFRLGRPRGVREPGSRFMIPPADSVRAVNTFLDREIPAARVSLSQVG